MTAGTTGQVNPEASASWRALGTGVQVVVTYASRLTAARAMLEADLAAVDLACSRFRPDSEIVALDRLMTGVPGGTGAEPVEISPLLAEAIAVALRAARLTDGDVDPTVGAAMNAAGYDRDFSLVQREGPAVKLTVRTIPGWRQVEFDESTRRLQIPPGVRLDLGATAKAWAADRSAARISAGLSCGVLVSLGGDIAVRGEPPAGGWRIRVQDISGSPGDPPAWPSAAAAWRPPVPRRGAGGGAATCCTTFSTRAPRCRPRLYGGRSRCRRQAAPTPTSPAQQRSSGAARRRPGSPASACRPAWSTRLAACARSAAGRRKAVAHRKTTSPGKPATPRKTTGTGKSASPAKITGTENAAVPRRQVTLHEPAAGSRLGGWGARAHPAPDSPGYRHGGGGLAGHGGCRRLPPAAHGGSVGVTSQPGRTSFVITLPGLDGPLSARSERPAPPGDPGPRTDGAAPPPA
jgi:hypothetical protein